MVAKGHWNNSYIEQFVSNNHSKLQEKFAGKKIKVPPENSKKSENIDEEAILGESNEANKEVDFILWQEAYATEALLHPNYHKPNIDRISS